MPISVYINTRFLQPSSSSGSVGFRGSVGCTREKTLCSSKELARAIVALRSTPTASRRATNAARQWLGPIEASIRSRALLSNEAAISPAKSRIDCRQGTAASEAARSSSFGRSVDMIMLSFLNTKCTRHSCDHWNCLMCSLFVTFCGCFVERACDGPHKVSLSTRRGATCRHSGLSCRAIREHARDQSERTALHPFCIHSYGGHVYPGGKRCYLCDPHHPYRLRGQEPELTLQKAG